MALPPGAPEAVVFGYVLENADTVANLVKQRCQCPSLSQDKIVEAIRQVSMDTTDHHLYFSKLGDRLGFISEIIVRRGLCSIYVENAAAVVMSMVATLRSKLA